MKLKRVESMCCSKLHFRQQNIKMELLFSNKNVEDRDRVIEILCPSCKKPRYLKLF
jgi:hypothetical protein